MTTIAADSDPLRRTDSHDDYQPMLDAVRRQFADRAGALFTTDAGGPGLWSIFLAALPEGERQQHNCHACRRFVEAYGGLVRIDEQGHQIPAMFQSAPGMYGDAFAAVHRAISKARVTGVFLSPLPTWGTPSTADGKRPIVWRHMSITPPRELVFSNPLKTADQVAAEKSEDYGMLCRALADFDRATLALALAIVDSDALFGGEKVKGPIAWLVELCAKRDGLRGRARDNVAWLAVATAPPGFCHVRSTMVGSLLEDVAAGLPFEAVKEKFGKKMNPTIYRRPVAPPSEGNIAQAEKIIAALGAAGALARRFARLEDIRPLWVAPPPAAPTEAEGVFGHLRPSAVDPARTVIKAPLTTWVKFTRALEGAQSIEVLVPSSGAFLALLTAVNPDAPPIIQWDHEGARNPVSWYVWPEGSPARQWGLTPGRYAKVTAVTLLPFMWDGTTDHGNHGAGAVFIIDGARDTREGSIGLFPSILKSEFHGISRTIEAYSRSRQLEGRAEASACGLEIRKGAQRPMTISARVVDRSGIATDFTIDRWD